MRKPYAGTKPAVTTNGSALSILTRRAPPCDLPGNLGWRCSSVGGMSRGCQIFGVCDKIQRAGGRHGGSFQMKGGRRLMRRMQVRAREKKGR